MRVMHVVSLLLLLWAAAAPPAAATATVSRQVVLEVLRAFKLGITGDPLRALASWDTSNLNSSSNNPCSSTAWTGVQCQYLSDMDLIANLSIALPSQSLQGSLTPELARLPILTYLDLTSNSLSGALPSLSNFSTMQNLQYLSLAQNSFHGPLTLPPSCFPNLLYFSVAENLLSGPVPSDQLSACPSLQLLNVSNNQFVGPFFPSGLGNLTSTLFKLDAGRNSLSGRLPPSIGNCSRLTFLSVPVNNFSGQLPSSIGLGCPNLVFVSLFYNNLSGNIPQEVGLLSKLSYLSIGLNQFSGDIFKFITNCSALYLLHVGQMHLTGRMPDDLGSKLSNLQFLILEQNMLTGTIPESLGNASGLDYLLLGSNYNISGTIPPALFQAQNISQLDLRYNLLSGSIPYQMGNLTSLQKAHLNNNQLTGSVPEELALLASLQVLALEHNSLSGNFPNQLFNCTPLMGLSLNDNSFVGAISSSIGSLAQLGNFDASNNNIAGPLPLELYNCTKLASISLSNNMLIGEIPNSVIAGLSMCSSFKLARNNLSGPTPNTEFQKMIFLQALDLSYNQLSGPIPAGLAGCVDLLSLNLSQNKLTGSIPSAFGGALLSLTHLEISHNSINGSIPGELGNLQSLQWLDLSFNALSGVIPSALENLKGLLFLNLSYNSQLQGVIPKGGSFRNLTRTSFLGDPGLCGSIVNKTCAISSKQHLVTKWDIVIIAAAGSVSLIIVGIMLILLNRRIKRGRQGLGARWDFDPYLRLTSEDVQRATRNFSPDNRLGAGVTGTVYKGIMEDGTSLVFKRFNLDNSSIRSFIGELQSVGLVRHRNLIKILGYLSNQLDVNILILEYMPNGNLHDHLHGHEEGLSWEARLRVAVGVAEGLCYLHNDCPAPVIHCDIKPQNILFGADMEVRITDFGLAKVMMSSTATSSYTDNMKGTLGYMAPELAAYGHISRRCDVYSYGILMMELVTGRKPYEEVPAAEGQGTTTLVEWVASKFARQEMDDIVDKRLQAASYAGDEIDQSIKQLLSLAIQCTRPDPRHRPTMRNVMQMLPSETLSNKETNKTLQLPILAGHSSTISNEDGSSSCESLL